MNEEVLVHADVSPEGRARLALGQLYAQRLRGRARALVVAAGPAPGSGPGAEDRLSQTRSAEAHAAAVAAQLAAEGRLAETLVTSSDRVRVDCASRMRAADLIVAGRPRPDAAFLDEDVFAAALFASGRPVVVAPPSLDVRAPERIVIAWKDCREAARAVHDARPLLTCAARVHVLCVKSPLDDVFLGRAALDRLQGTLGRWGVQGVSSEVVEGGADSAATLALAASEAGADLLVMGGYGRWPVSEMVFGGMTRHVLQHAPWPVFMAR